MTLEPNSQTETKQLVTLPADAVEDLEPRDESDTVAGGIIAVLKPLLPAV